MKLQTILKYIITACAIAIVALPLFVDGSVIYAYTFSKIIGFQILVEVSVAAYIVLQFLDSSYRVDWKNKLIRAQSIWIGILIIVSFVSVDAYRSWWSTAQWMTGTITYLHFFAWFVVLAGVCKQWSDWRRLFMVSVGVALLAALYGIGQALGIFWTHYDPTLGRIYSTLGNPIYFSLYLLLNIFVAALLFMRERYIFVKILLVFFALLFVGTIFLTGTRSAALTLFISIIAFGMLSLAGGGERWRIISVSLLGTFIACVVGIFFWFQSPGGVMWSNAHIPQGMQRLVSQTFQDPARIELSRIAFHGLADHPLLGWGPNNYSYIFSAYVKPEDYGTVLSSAWYDQAHNQALNILATTGIIGLIAYLLPWIAAWWLLWKRFISRAHAHERAIYSIVALSLFAYFLQNLTAFDTPGPLIMLYLMFGFVSSIGNDERREASSAENGKKILRPFLLSPIAFILLVVLATVNVIPYVKEQMLKKAIDSIDHDFGRGVMLYRKAIEGFSFTQEGARNELARTVLFYNGKYEFSVEKKKELFSYAISEMEKSAHRHPWSIEYSLPLLSLYRGYALYVSDSLQKGETLARKLAYRYPHRRDILAAYMFFERDLKKYDVAKQYAQKIINLDPSRAESYWWKATVLASSGDAAGALENIDRAKEMRYPIFKDSSIYIQLAVLSSNDNYQHLSSLMIEAWSNDGLHALDLAEASAITQAKLGKKDNVNLIIGWIRERDENYAKRVEEEIKNLSL